jgi:hypothetical protein
MYAGSVLEHRIPLLPLNNIGCGLRNISLRPCSIGMYLIPRRV